MNDKDKVRGVSSATSIWNTGAIGLAVAFGRTEIAPEDRVGQALIQEWINFIRRREARPHLVFLSDYDMRLTEHLVQGVDVWINTLKRPWEACGTSGMKVLVNGGINLSELDGWWAEAYSPEVGWALGDGREHGDDPEWEAAEAEALYADGWAGSAPVSKAMKMLGPIESVSGSYRYGAQVPAVRPHTDYTARVIPYRKGVAVPLEDARILWQR